MPPSKAGGNSKKEAGRAKKAENEEKKKDVEKKVKESKEAEAWKDGAKGSSKADSEAAKKAELARKKAEREALLAAEEAAAPSKAKAAPKAGAKKKPASDKPLIPAGGGIINFTTTDPQGVRRAKGEDGQDLPVDELSAVGLEQMIEALEVVNHKTDKQSMGAKAGMIEQHPERRFKAAFEAYVEREMPILKEEHKGLRQNQMRDILYKQFQKAPENPFNQAKIAYNATKDEKVDALKQIMDAREAKYKVEQ